MFQQTGTILECLMTASLEIMGLANEMILDIVDSRLEEYKQKVNNAHHLILISILYYYLCKLVAFVTLKTFDSWFMASLPASLQC
jgi:hypothetical protein